MLVGKRRLGKTLVERHIVYDLIVARLERSGDKFVVTPEPRAFCRQRATVMSDKLLNGLPSK